MAVTSNIDESYMHNGEQKKPVSKTAFIWFHLSDAYRLVCDVKVITTFDGRY